MLPKVVCPIHHFRLGAHLHMHLPQSFNIFSWRTLALLRGKKMRGWNKNCHFRIEQGLSSLSISCFIVQQTPKQSLNWFFCTLTGWYLELTIFNCVFNYYFIVKCVLTFASDINSQDIFLCVSVMETILFPHVMLIFLLVFPASVITMYVMPYHCLNVYCWTLECSVTTNWGIQ